MGYTTDFFGKFKLSKPLTQDQNDYLIAYSETRHFKRNVMRLNMPHLMSRLNIDFGKDGEFYITKTPKYESFAQEYKVSSTIDYNEPPGDCPGLWCNWIPSENGSSIEWNQAEKFYNYTEWLNFIIEKFLIPWGIDISGYVEFQGEDDDDRGFLRIKNNHAYIDKEILIFD